MEKSKTKVDLLIINAKVLTLDANDRILNTGAVAVQGTDIVAVGESQPLKMKYAAAETIDATGHLLMPGLINTHSHSAMTIFRGFADDLNLEVWLNDYVFPYEKEFVNRHSVEIGSSLAMIEMIKSGTTTFCDLYYFMDIIAEIADKTGMRAVLCEGLTDFPTPHLPDSQSVLAFVNDLLANYKEHSRIQIGLAPHAPYTCSPKLLKTCKQFTDNKQLLLTTHLAETRWEFDKFIRDHKQTPTQYLDSLNLLDNNVLLAHAIHLTNEDIHLLATKRAAVAHNPECNMKLVSGTAPIPDLQKAGVPCGLGTDGVASNNNLDMFQEMRSAAFIHKLTSNNPTVADARSIVKMATIDGARALNLDDKTGSIEIGKRADILMIDLRQAHLQPLYDLYSQIVYSMSGQDVGTVIVDGKIVMRNRKLLTINEQEILNRLPEVSYKIAQHLKK